MKELRIAAKTENLPVVLGFVNKSLQERGCPMKLQTRIAIAVEEVFVNIAHYAYNLGEGEAVLRLSDVGDVVIEFEDSGVPYNPLLRQDPDITAGAEERQVGGLGIYMVKNIMDTVEYRYEGGKNILTLCKKI